jgi:hypothetical protein
MTKIKKKFDGPLAEPMRPLVKGIIAQAQNDPTNTYHAKLKLLCEYYKIKPNQSQYLELALSLAIDFVPGFQEKKKRGAKNKWTKWSGACLVVEIERLINDTEIKSKGVSWAVNQLSKKEPWKSFVNSKGANNKSNALRQQYYNNRKKEYIDIFRYAFMSFRSDNKLDNWEKLIIQSCK